MSDTATETVERLEAERRRLALAVEEGEATAAELERLPSLPDRRRDGHAGGARAG
jgi:hypothetical protein